MAEDRTWNDGILMLQTMNQRIHILLWVEAQTMHARIQFDVYWPTRNTLFLGSLDKCIHQSEGIYLRFQVIIEHGLEGSHLRIHNHDVLRNAIATQSDTLVSHSHSQIVHTMVL